MRETGRDDTLISCLSCGMPVMPYGPYQRGQASVCKRCMEEKFGMNKLNRQEFINLCATIVAVTVAGALVLAVGAAVVWLWRVALG